MEKNREASPHGMGTGLILLLVFGGTVAFIVLFALMWPFIKTAAGLIVGFLAIAGFLMVTTRGRRY